MTYFISVCIIGVGKESCVNKVVMSISSSMNGITYKERNNFRCYLFIAIFVEITKDTKLSTETLRYVTDQLRDGKYFDDS